jgi:signal transduction histidine kinase
MYVLRYWSLYITTASFRVRFAIVGSSLIICMVLYTLLFPLMHNGSIVMLTILLSAWLFKYRGMFINVIITSIAIYIINNIFYSSIVSEIANLFVLLFGTIVGTLIGLIGCLLRQAFDTVVASRQKVMQAEQEKVQAYESQREAQQSERRITLAYEQQQQLNQQKDLFLAHVNHELCTPLVTVSGYLELLLAYYERLDDTKKISYMRKALDSAQELNQLVANLLDAAQFTANMFSPSYEKISLAQATQEVLTKWNPHDLQNFTFLVEIPDTVTAWADGSFLFHILRNLISNACKYAPKHTTIHIQATNDTGESQKVCLSVKDEGKGIPPAQIALLFEKFVRLPQDKTGAIRGTGLGLYICKQFAEAMNGRIWVESSGRPGEGSCFYLSLPSVEPAHLPALK